MMAAYAPWSYARSALDNARTLVTVEAATARDHAHALFTLRVFSDAETHDSPPDGDWVVAQAEARVARRVEEMHGDIRAALDAAIGDAPDAAVRVVLARWLVEVAP